MNQNTHQLYVRSIKMDILRCFIITPITIFSIYICVIAADFYSSNNYDNFPPAKWTTYSLLAMMFLFFLSYFFWMYSMLKYHQRVWYYWWQKTSVVKMKNFHSYFNVNKNSGQNYVINSHGVSIV